MDIRKRRIEAYRAAQGNKPPAEGKTDNRKVPAKRSEQPRDTPTDGTKIPEAGQNPPQARTREAENALLKTGAEEKGYRKAAEFILLLGRDEAAEVLRHMSSAEVEGITREIASIESIDTRQAQRILSEFGRLRESAPAQTTAGGTEIALEILRKAFGEETADRVYRNSVQDQERPFAFLSDLDTQQIMLILRGEPPAVLSVILALSDPALSASILKALGAEHQKEVIRRLSRMQKVDPSVIVKIEESLREKIRNTGKVVTEKVNGKSALVDILRYIDSQSERRILEDLKDRNPALFEEVSEMLFSPEIILQIEDMSLQNAFRELSDQDIALFLKGKSEAIRRKVLANVSERRRQFILDEYGTLGAVRRSDVDDITKAFLERFKKMYEAGTLLIYDEGDSYIR